MQAAESGRALVATNSLLVEVAALLQHRFGPEAVRDLATRILPILRVVWVREEQHRRALELLFRADRRSLSLVDCVSFVVMGTEGLSESSRAGRGLRAPRIPHVTRPSKTSPLTPVGAEACRPVGWAVRCAACLSHSNMPRACPVRRTATSGVLGLEPRATARLW
jgi:hypothetical protein